MTNILILSASLLLNNPLGQAAQEGESADAIRASWSPQNSYTLNLKYHSPTSGIFTVEYRYQPLPTTNADGAICYGIAGRWTPLYPKFTNGLGTNTILLSVPGHDRSVYRIRQGLQQGLLRLRKVNRESGVSDPAHERLAAAESGR